LDESKQNYIPVFSNFIIQKKEELQDITIGLKSVRVGKSNKNKLSVTPMMIGSINLTQFQHAEKFRIIKDIKRLASIKLKDEIDTNIDLGSTPQEYSLRDQEKRADFTRFNSLSDKSEDKSAITSKLGTKNDP